MQSFLSCDVSKTAVFSRILVNKFFGFLTLGIYRFWGKTHLRRMIWQSVRIGDDRLTYHGTAKELFIGFLIAMLLLSVLFGGIGIALQFMVFSSPQLLGIEQAINIVFLAAFWQFARYRLWRYRLSRTSFRTVRFFQKGKATLYAGHVMLWGLISLFTLGWAYPKLRAVQNNYRINNMAFGDRVFDFRGQTREFFRIYLPVIIFVNASLFVGVIVQLNTDVFVTLMEVSGGGTTENPEHIPYMAGVFLGLGVVGFILFVFARVKEFNYTVGQTSFAGARFRAQLPVASVFRIGFGIVLVNILFFCGIGFLVYVGIRENIEAVQIYFIGAFIAYFMLFDVMKYLFLFVPMLKLICASIAVDQPTVFTEVAAGAHEAPSYGEGLADALDVGAF